MFCSLDHFEVIPTVANDNGKPTCNKYNVKMGEKVKDKPERQCFFCGGLHVLLEQCDCASALILWSSTGWMEHHSSKIYSLSSCFDENQSEPYVIYQSESPRAAHCFAVQ